jgi:hypothetical protein
MTQTGFGNKDSNFEILTQILNDPDKILLKRTKL